MAERVIFHGERSNMNFIIYPSANMSEEDLNRLDRIVHYLQNGNRRALIRELNNFPYAFISDAIRIDDDNENNFCEVQEFTDNPLYHLLLEHDVDIRTRIQNVFDENADDDENNRRREILDSMSWLITNHKDNVDHLRILVNSGMNIDETPARGGGDNMTILQQYMDAEGENADLNYVRQLLELGANPRLRTRNNGRIIGSALDMARGNEELVALFEGDNGEDILIDENGVIIEEDIENEENEVQNIVGDDEEPRQRSVEELTCAICFVNERRWAFMPCGHLATCRRCLDRMVSNDNGRKTCPICGIESSNQRRIFYFSDKQNEDGCNIL
jgi:ribosomal protein L37E